MSSIFLVEDEVLIRMLLADMVQELGHSVAAEAGTIEEGLRLARTAEFDVAILDVTLGSRTVEPIVEVIDGRGLPIILASGYSETGLPPSFAGRRLLEKPFRISQLAVAIAGSCAPRGSDVAPEPGTPAAAEPSQAASHHAAPVQHQRVRSA